MFRFNFRPYLYSLYVGGAATQSGSVHNHDLYSYRVMQNYFLT